MSNPAIPAPTETSRVFRFHLRMEIANPQKYWNYDHDANAYVTEQMKLFKIRCVKFLTEHLPKGKIVGMPRESRWFYSTAFIGGKKVNYRAILQCTFATFEEVVELVDALAPDDTISLEINDHEHVVEIVWPNRPRKQEYFMDINDETDSTPILDPDYAKAALQANGFQPTQIIQSTEKCGEIELPTNTWIATLEVENLKKIEPIRFMFGDRTLNNHLSRRTALNRQQPHTSGLQALAVAKAEYAEFKNGSKNYREALMTNQAMYPSTPTKRSRTVLFSNASQRGMDRRRPSPAIERKYPPQTEPIPIQPPEPSLLQEDAIHAQELQEIAACLEQNPEIMDDL
eukprot:jgi/Picre1/33385/NNA_008709.t1